jgi:hypothetical protein
VASGALVAGPEGIAVTGEGIYWANRTGNSVVRLAVSGGAPEVLSAADVPMAVAVSGGYAVWAAQDGVFGCTVASCASSRVKIAAPMVIGSIRAVAYDGQYVFFTDQGTGASDGIAARCPPAAGCPGQVTLGNGYDVALGVALYDALVLWTVNGNGNQNGAVFYSPKGGGGASQVTASLTLPSALAADGLDVYWTEAVANGGKVRRCPYGGGYCQNPDDLATGLAAPLDLALGGGRVYWSDIGDGLVLSCPTAGCGSSPPTVHASGRTGLRRIALSQTCVFWTDDEGGGSVSKAAR